MLQGGLAALEGDVALACFFSYLMAPCTCNWELCSKGDSLRLRGLTALKGARCAQGGSLRSRGLAALAIMELRSKDGSLHLMEASLPFFTQSTSHYLVFLTLLSQGSCAPRKACCACWGKLCFQISITQPLTSKQTSFFFLN